MLEVKHLKTLLALEQCGTLNAAAERLFLSQSALSHQMRELEGRLGTRLFERKTSPVRFTPQGQQLLALAHEVIPRIREVEQRLLNHDDHVNHLRIGIECHACFQWLVPAMEQYKTRFPGVSVDLNVDNLFDGVTELQQQRLELLFTDDEVKQPGLTYSHIGDFSLVLALSPNHPLASKAFIEANDIEGECLLTYPVSTDKLDVFRLFLQPAGVRPKEVKAVSNSSVMLQMVSAGMGVAAVPDWLIRDLDRHQLLVSRPLGPAGIAKSLSAAYLPGSSQPADSFLPIVKQTFAEMQTQCGADAGARDASGVV
ncbi:HTH-type transcriptional regulator MetR [Saliniradius amylolyticus]|uniref:HTH-type transcriptional regulator MetR n=1 Tax=Saliniradius amylolyticus TaxID=2183582 RepID=A0A2S2E6C7_9ALTE|nr:LysR substrate-binding domain-containing protein [Saliniradius amylolyticus]AWL13082.1 HTH-type transcriptional regulator MetR [Saliniradius amylolyticus]